MSMNVHLINWITGECLFKEQIIVLIEVYKKINVMTYSAYLITKC